MEVKRPSDVLFYTIREYLEENSKYQPKVLARADSDTFPKVVVNQELNNPNWQTMCSREIVQRHTVTLDIYARDTDEADSITIAEEIQDCLYNLMSKELKMKITFSRPTPNVDNSIYRITMKYTYQIKV